MIRAVIIEDTKEHRKSLLTLLKDIEDVEVIGQFENTETGLNGIRQLQPELVFLDVEMPPGKTGLELLAEIPSTERTFDVIFTTQFNRFAVDAIELSCLAYLVKPIEADKLKDAVEKHRAEANKELLLTKYEVLVEHLKELPPGEKPLMLPLSSKTDERGYRAVKMEEIAYFASPSADGSSNSASGRYTTFFLTDESKIEVSNLLRHWEAKLNPYGFVRISKGMVVNMKYVHTYRKSESTVTLSYNGNKTPVLTIGDRYKSGFESGFIR